MNLHNLTVCDQVRQEVNGKFILIGVYTNGIIVPQLPSTFFLSVWMLLETDTLGNNSFKLRVRMPEIGVDLSEFQVEVDVIDLENWTPIGVGGNVLIEQAGTMTIEAKLGDEKDWSVLRSLSIKKGPVVTSM